MGTACCGQEKNFDGLSWDYKRRLWWVIGLNASMFGVEIVAGHLAGSRALQADALDFFGDTLTYGLSLAVIGVSLRIRASAALLKGLSLLFMGAGVFGTTLYSVWVQDRPQSDLMGLVGFLALLTNLASVLLLVRYKDGDANVRSVWLCSRNDTIGNIAVMLAALAVWGTGSHWPDILVAALMAGLFLTSAVQILKQGAREWLAVQSGPIRTVTIIGTKTYTNLHQHPDDHISNADKLHSHVK